MASDRQRRIREHIAKSSDGLDFQRSPQNYESLDSLEQSNNKKRIEEHLTRSKGNYDLNGGTKQERKSKIMNHIRLTKG
ncbi:hypothetical protein [Myxosarcina sp. GI1]|uniref:hypothetical protein n=1 Tax=Myxosarcina sp. GI1 TaxID=1541065 RepID=UPI000569819F|nr:hypothetical protein [Myxosarcina sp. GI1]